MRLPVPPKRIVGWDEFGRRTAHSLKKDKAWHDFYSLTMVPGWEDMMSDIMGCETVFQLQKCRWHWAAKVIEYKWPTKWITRATEEFDEALDCLTEMKMEKENGNGTT